MHDQQILPDATNLNTHLWIGNVRGEERPRKRPPSAPEIPRYQGPGVDDHPFIVLTETKFSFRCIPVWIGTLLTGLGSKKNTCDNVLTMTSTVPW